MKHPVWLPSHHYLVTLLIKEAHERVLHNGQKETLNQLRLEYHITKLRQKVRSFIHRCTICKKHSGKPYEYPEPYDLPKSRLEPGVAFKNVGIDYCGPYAVYNVYNKNNETFKAWIALITCQTSRAIYVDLATNYSGDACISVLRRFINRRGIPEMIFSDKGTSFTAENVQNYALNQMIRWEFSLDKAPWFNGFTERLVKSVKMCLNKTLNNKKVNYEEMLTLLSEIERTINNRPLTYIYDELTEEPLTPNHLLYGRKLYRNSSGNETEEIIDMAENVKTLLQHFWKRWKFEYLLELREHQKSCQGRARPGREMIKKNDMVLILEDGIKRNKWRMGRIHKLLEGKDGKVRGAEVVVVNKTGTGILRRPVNKLFPFEYNSNKLPEEETSKITFVDDNLVNPILGRGV